MQTPGTLKLHSFLKNMQNFLKVSSSKEITIKLEKELKIENRYTWGDGDSLDRERVRDILLQNYNFQWTK